jgi:hypothetical protein
MQAIFMNLVPPSSRFFLNSGPKKALSLSLDVKCDQQAQKKNIKMSPTKNKKDVSIKKMSPTGHMASISRKLSNKVP